MNVSKKSNIVIKIIAAVVICAVVIILCRKIFSITKDKEHDVSITSTDGKATLILEKITTGKVENMVTSCGKVIFEVKDAFAFYEKASLNNAYLFSVDSSNNAEKTYSDTNVYFMNGNYFFTDRDDDNFKLCKLETIFVIDSAQSEKNWFRVQIPAIYHESDGDFFNYTAGERELFLKWSETIGMKSFDDLVSFFGRIGSNAYLIDTEKEEILCKTYKAGYNNTAVWMDEYAVKITCVSDGIHIEVLSEFVDSIMEKNDVWN